MPKLFPFRSYSEHDVINLFACTTEATKGTIVKISQTLNPEPLDLTDYAPGAKYNGTLNNLFYLNSRIDPSTSYLDPVLGILLNDVRELDENGNKLIYDPRKKAEMSAVLPLVEAAPVLTRGIILINDIDTTARYALPGGNPTINAAAYVGDNGQIATAGVTRIGKFLSTLDSNNYCFVKINFD